MKLYEFLISVSGAICLWTLITCKCESGNRNVTFRQKYSGQPYRPWTKMQEADNITLANICLNFFSMEKDEGTEIAAEAHKITNNTVSYPPYGDVTLDMICCKFRYRNVGDQYVGEAIYYLTEGRNESTAFKFFLINGPEDKLRVIIGGEFKHIWNLTIDPSAKLGSKYLVDMDFYKY